MDLEDGKRNAYKGADSSSESEKEPNVENHINLLMQSSRWQRDL